MPITTPDGITYTDAEVAELGGPGAFEELLKVAEPPPAPKESANVVIDGEEPAAPEVASTPADPRHWLDQGRQEHVTPAYAPLKLVQPRHVLICNMLAAGRSSIQVARKLGICRETVYKVSRDPRFRELIREMQERDRAGFMRSQFEGLAQKSVEVLEAVLEDPRAKNADRIQAAKTVLDRAGYGPTTTVKTQQLDPEKMSDAELMEVVRREQLGSN